MGKNDGIKKWINGKKKIKKKNGEKLRNMMKKIQRDFEDNFLENFFWMNGILNWTKPNQRKGWF